MNAIPQQHQEDSEAVVAEVLVDDEEKGRLESEEEARLNRLDLIGQTLTGWRNDAIAFRSDVEMEWLESHAQYDVGDVINGEQRGTREFPADSGSTPDYRRTRDNITRPAVLMVTSRVADMLFPTSDRNWDLSPSPDAVLPAEILAEEANKIMEDRQRHADAMAQAKAQQAQQNGEEAAPPQPDAAPQLGYDEMESIEQKAAEIRCGRMRTLIDDQLAESSYSAHGRDAIADAAMYGTGVIKGPFPKKRRARVYEDGRWVSKYLELPSPAATYVDLFNFYPRPARRMPECPGVFQLHLMPAESLRKLAHQPGFDRRQIARAVSEENKSTSSLSQSVIYRMGITSRSGITASLLDNRFAVWEYHGSMPKQGLIDFMVGLLNQQQISAELASEIIAEAEADPMLEVNCEVWEVAGVVIKLVLAPVRELATMYHVYNYEERPDILFGKGVPAVMRDDQLAATQLWQAMMLNAMMSAGLQIAVKKGALEPMGQQGGKHDMSFSRPRVWAFTDEVKDIREAMQVFEVPNVLDNLMPLYERSKKNAEEHIVLPSIVQGEPTQSVQTSSGLAMLMNAGNIVSRRLAKAWDDNITVPMLTGFFDWNMDHGPDDVKGDYTVIPRGSSHLLVKDVQSQRFLFALQTYAATPKLEGMMKWEEWARQGLVVMDMDANRLLYSDSELKQREAEQAANPPPPDPAIVIAKARAAEAQTRQQTAETNGQIAQSRLQQDADNSAAAIQARRDDNATRLQIAQMNMMTALAKLDQNERVQMEQLAAKAGIEGLWARLQAGELAQKERRDAVEIAVESPDPRLA